MRDEGDVYCAHRRGQRWRLVFIIAYCALVVFCLATPALRIPGILLIPFASLMSSPAGS